jgi:ferric-dicitrate binding protein FerR (iron transport regulator)
MSNVSHTPNAARDDAGLSKLAAVVREAQSPSLRLADPHEHARARARLLQAVDRAAAQARPARAARVSSGWRWGLGTLAAAACALAVVIAWPDGTLEFSVDGVEAHARETIVASEYTRMLEFSDQSTIELEPSSSMMIAELRSTGASVVLERGEVSLAVHHEDETSWQVAAGPYEVHVTGTEFSVTWEPQREYFEVEVEEGSVRVEGPEGEIAKLRAGESLVRERGKATIEPETFEADEPRDAHGVGPIAALDQPPQPTIDAPDELALEDVGDTEQAIADKLDKPSPARGPSWTTFFEDADYPGAWQALEQTGGIDAAAKRADAKSLLDLADVARFTKHREDARKVLELLRQRFPGSDEAGEAAFTLGRLMADSGSQAKAASYFEVYLSERPTGSLTGDALARLMDCYEALGQTAEMKSAAERYLARFPKGPHAGKAQAILGE